MGWRTRKQNPEIEEAKKHRDELLDKAGVAIKEAEKATDNVDRLQDDLIEEYKDAEERRDEGLWS